MGTPDFAVPSLRALASDARVELVGVWSQPDRPAGRGHRLVSPPVALAGRAIGVPVVQPESLRPDAAFEELAAYAPELIVVAAYGQILRPRVLALPAHGCVNVHASLLPRWRGAAPIHRAIEAGDVETGVCIMQMEAGLDTGAVYHEVRTPIGPHDTSGTLHDRLAELGARALLDALDRVLDPTFVPRPQPDSGVTYASKLGPQDRSIRFDRPAREVAAHIRAMSPSPGARMVLLGELVGVFAADVVAVPGAERPAPGTVLAAGPDGVVVATSDGAVRLIELQRPGRRRLGASEFMQGLAPLVGAVATSP